MRPEVPTVELFSDENIGKIQNELDGIMRLHHLFSEDPTVESFKIRMATGTEDANQGTDAVVLLTRKTGEVEQIRVQTKHLAIFVDRDDNYSVAVKGRRVPIPTNFWRRQLLVLEPDESGSVNQVLLDGSRTNNQSPSFTEVEKFICDDMDRQAEFSYLQRNTRIDRDENRHLFANTNPTKYQFAYLLLPYDTGTTNIRR